MGYWGFLRRLAMSTLCESCSRAVPTLCKWIDKGDRTGLECITRFATSGPRNKYEIVKVIGCPRYEPGPLLALKRRTLYG